MGSCVSPREARAAANFLEYQIVCSIQLRLDLIVSPNIQQRSHFYIVPVLCTIRHLANTHRKRLKTQNPDSPMNVDLKPPQKQVSNPDFNPHYTHRVNTITHINLCFNADLPFRVKWVEKANFGQYMWANHVRMGAFACAVLTYLFFAFLPVQSKESVLWRFSFECVATIMVPKWSIHLRIHCSHPACLVEFCKVSSAHKFRSMKEHGRQLCNPGENRCEHIRQ